MGIGYYGSGSMKCHHQPLAQHHHVGGLWNRHFAAGSFARGEDRPGITPVNLSLSLVKEEEGREEDGWKEGRRREREGIWGARNVKLSWLNTGQIYRTIDAFGPLQPAVVDISLRHWSTKRRAATIAPRGMRYHLRITLYHDAESESFQVKERRRFGRQCEVWFLLRMVSVLLDDLVCLFFLSVLFSFSFSLSRRRRRRRRREGEESVVFRNDD